MGIIRRRFLFEDDNQDTTGGQQPTVSGGEDNGGAGAEDYSVDTQDDADTTANDNTDNNAQDTQSDDNNQTEETNNDQNNEEQQQDTDEDYSVNTDEDESQTDDTGEGEDTNTDNSSDGSTQPSEPEEENELDKELFDNLTDDEKKRKVNTLKKLYIDLYSKCNALIEKFNQMSKGDQDLQEVSKRVLKIIYDLKEYISYYVLNIFDNKSYLENDINFNRYLLILNGIKDAVGDIVKSKEKEEPK